MLMEQFKTFFLVRTLKRASKILTAFVLCAPLAYAQEPLPAPKGPPILLVSGNIEVTNSERGAEFDREMLAALGVTTIETTTSWTDGVQVFEGVLARTVLDRVGASGETVVATALNDFVSPVPMSEIRKYNVLLAMTMNGKQMAVSDKGPIWIVYPRNDHRELQDSKYNDRWVWQLRELRVE